MDPGVTADVPPHERLSRLEELTRAMEKNIANKDPPALDIHAWHMEHFDECADQRLVIQKITVSTGMLLFANTARDILRREEALWREGEYATVATAAPGLVERVVPDFGEPILFMSVSRVMAVLRCLRKAWYGSPMDPGEVGALLRWVVCRVALLITYPFDGETFDEPEYRQPYGEIYLASIPLVFDTYAMIGSMQRDLWAREQMGAHPGGAPTAAPPTLDETPAWRFMDRLMGKVQGDSLCITFQKAFMEASLRVGDALLFARRRPSAIAPTHMDIIAECHGVDYSRETHKRADIRLADIYREERYRDLIWLIVLDYYFCQKTQYPWMERHVVHRLSAGEDFPRLLYVPVENVWAVEYSAGKAQVYGGIIQAVLHWMRACPPSFMLRGTRYDVSDIVGEFI